MSPEIQMIVFLAIGLFFLFAYYGISQKLKKLNETGVKAEGVIFEVEWDHNTKGNYKYSTETVYPVVRFVTKDGTWITKKSSQGGVMIKQGQTVQIVYNPENPEEFMITSGQFKWYSYIFLVVGLIGITIGIYKLIAYLSA